MTMDQKAQKLEQYLNMARALLQSMDSVISNVPEDTSVWHYASYKGYATQYTRLVEAIAALEPLPNGILFPYDINKISGVGDTLHIQQKSMFQQVHGDLSMLCSWLDAALGKTGSSSEVRSLEDFISSKLRPAMVMGRPESERDVQNTMEQILIGRGMQKGIDYDRETGRVKHSGKESIPDFIFRPISLALEIKLIKEKSNISRIIDEINADLVAYGKEYENVMFVVYDNGEIGNVDEFKRDIESSGKSRVLVVKN